MSAATTEPARVRGLDGVWGRAAARHGRAAAAVRRRCVYRDAPEGSWLHVWAARRRADGRLVAFRRDPLAFARDADAFVAQALAWHARGLEVFAGVLPRTDAAAGQRRGGGGGAAVGRRRRAGRARRSSTRSAPSTPPTTSPPRAAAGATPRGCSTRRRPAGELAAACRRLAGAVGGDLAVCHPGASLRLPGTRNGKPGAGDVPASGRRPRASGLPARGAGGCVAGSRRRRRGAIGNGAGRRAAAGGGRRGAATIRSRGSRRRSTSRRCAGWRCRKAAGRSRARCRATRTRTRRSWSTPSRARGWRCFSHPGGSVGGRIYDLASALAADRSGWRCAAPRSSRPSARAEERMGAAR